MDNWLAITCSIFTLVTGIGTYVASIVTVRNKTEQNNKDISDLKAQHIKDIDEVRKSSIRHHEADELLHSKLFEKLDGINETITEHKTRLGNAPSMEQVRAEFVSKEMFKQMEKHIDEKFDKVENGIDKILSKLEKV